MTVLTRPRHPLIEHALADAHSWCAGYTIDAQPAIVHAIRVAVTVGDHEPRVTPHVVAAALLHDSPEFAPPEVDLNDHLTRRHGPDVLRIVRGLQAEHAALDTSEPTVCTDDRDLLLLSTADKVVALTSAIRRARRSGDIDSFFAARRPLLLLLPHFRACSLAAHGHLPTSLTHQLGSILDDLDHLTKAVTPV